MYELRTKTKPDTKENLFYFCEFGENYIQEVVEIKPIDKGAERIINHMKKLSMALTEYQIEATGNRNEIAWLKSEIERLKDKQSLFDRFKELFR